MNFGLKAFREDSTLMKHSRDDPNETNNQRKASNQYMGVINTTATNHVRRQELLRLSPVQLLVESLKSRKLDQ